MKYVYLYNMHNIILKTKKKKTLVAAHFVYIFVSTAAVTNLMNSFVS